MKKLALLFWLLPWLALVQVGPVLGGSYYGPVGGAGPVVPQSQYFVLDHLLAYPAVAYSVRQLTAGPNLPTYDMTVQRASDNTTQNIGFSGGWINTAQLASFCAATNCYVVTWKNQGSLGSSGDASQSTAADQPQIVASGVVETWNGQPSVALTSTTDLNVTLPSSVLNSSGGFFVGCVTYVPNAVPSANAYVFNNRGSNGWAIRYQGSLSYQVAFFNAGTGGASASQTIGSTYFNTPLILSINYSGSLFTSSWNGNRYSVAGGSYNSNSPNTLWINGLSNATGAAGYGSEYIGFNSGISNSDWATYDLNAAAAFNIAGVTQ